MQIERRRDVGLFNEFPVPVDVHPAKLSELYLKLIIGPRGEDEEPARGSFGALDFERKKN